MNISHISYYLPNNTVSLSQLCDANELTRSEAAVMKRMMGLEFVARDSTRTPYDNLCVVLSALLKECPVKRDCIRYIFITHTADYIAPFQYNLSLKIKKQFHFYQALCFGSVINKCATPFHFFYLANQLFSGFINSLK